MTIPKWLSPALVSFLLISTFLILVIASSGGDILELAKIGSLYSESDPNGSEGYDGQFTYYIALDPNPDEVQSKLDVPAYRYQRILLPLLARIFSFGQAHWLPWLFPLISIAAHITAVRKLSLLISSWGANRWFVLSYALWPGLILAIRLDLPEALAMSFVVFAIAAAFETKHRLSWILFALALFTKETMLVFVLGMLIYYFMQKMWMESIGLIASAILPFLIFQFWLLSLFGEFGIGSGGIRATPLEIIPFNGIWKIAHFGFPLMLAFALIYIPIVILPSLKGLWAAGKKIINDDYKLTSIFLFISSAVYLFLPFSLYSEPIGLLRILSLLLLSWLLFAAKTGNIKALKYALLGIILNAILISEIIFS